jgi:hypothetical protein
MQGSGLDKLTSRRIIRTGVVDNEQLTLKRNLEGPILDKRQAVA